MGDGIEAIGRRDTDDVRVEASEQEIDDARDKALQARLKDNRHPLTNGEYQAINRERLEIRQRRETRAYAATKRGGDGGGASPSSPMFGVGNLGLSHLMAAQSGLLLTTTNAAPRDPASMSNAQLSDEIAQLKKGIAAFKQSRLEPPKGEAERLAALEKEVARRGPDAPPIAPPPQGPPIVPVDRMRSSAEIEAAIQREQAFLAGPLAHVVSVDERKTHEKYLADLESAARVVRTPASAAKPETPETIMAEIDRLRGVLAKRHDAVVDAPVRARIADLERQWVVAAKARGLTPAPQGIDPETASDAALKTEMTWLAGGGVVPMHVQMTQGADAYRQRLQEEALLRKPGGLEILMRLHAGDPSAQKRLVTHALQRIGGDATSRPGDSVASLMSRYYDTVAAQARAGNAAVRAMPTMGHDGLVFPNAEDAERYEVAQRIVAMNPGTTFGSIAASLRAMNGGTLDEIRAAGEAGNVVEGAGGGVAPALGAGRGRGVHYDTTQKPQVGLVQPNGARPAMPRTNGATTSVPPARPAGPNGAGARVTPPPPPSLVVPQGAKLPTPVRDGGLFVTNNPPASPPTAPPAGAKGVKPAPPVPVHDGAHVGAPPRVEPPREFATSANAQTLATRYVGRKLDPNAPPPGYDVHRMGDGSLRLQRKPRNGDATHAPLHVDEQGVVRFGKKTPAPDNAVIPNGTSLAAAHSFMTSDEVPSFKAYARMLVDNGIATEAEIEAALAKNGFAGKNVSDVRHALKEAFRARVMDRMTLATSASVEAAKKRYPDLPWAARPEAAAATARHREMVRLTTGLNSSDIGTLAEEWYREVSGLKGAATHVGVDRQRLQAQGIKLTDARFIDVVQGERAHEIKRVSGPLDKRNMEQFVDMMKIANAMQPVDIGGARTIREVRYTFLDPRGVKANAQFMQEALEHNKHLEFEIFNARGESMTVSVARNNLDALCEPALSRWLGI